MAGIVEVTIKADNTDEVKRALQAQAVAALEALGLQVEKYAKLELETPKLHADGSIRPNVDTGRLVNSITHVVKEDEQAVYVGTNVEYAPYVELGTSQSKPYPYLKPAVTEHTDEYKKIIEAYLKGQG